MGAMSQQPSQQPPEDPTPPDVRREPADGADPRVVVVTPQGMGIAEPPEEGEPGPADLVSQPAKVMRIGSMVKQLLEEVRSAPLDEAGRHRLAEIHDRSLSELEDGLAPDLVEELRRIALPFAEGAAPSESELRIAQAQLVGWLEGLFHGIQTALVAQQMAAQAQLQEMRRALPGAMGPAGAAGAAPGQARGPGPRAQPGGTGQYL
ncbi:proteasome activator [Kineococcus auxinigenes]|uniref:proteasome activator n=1 Tax=unclassified Kineococcus TaxID=2621656 RepID=UPI003D7C8546